LRLLQGLAMCASLGACAPAAGPAATPAPVHRGLVVLVGDSTMASNTGYGNALCDRLTPALDCWNLARGGRSTLSYRSEGLWDALIARLKARPATSPPAHVLIQFGHNDQPGRPGRSTDLATEFPANLARYVDEARAAGAVPVLVTPLTRRSFKDGALDDQLRPWAEAAQRVASERRAPLLPLHALSMARVQALGPDGADELAETAPDERRFDRTHVGERGACVFAELVSQSLAREVPMLDTPRSPAPDCETLLPPAQRFSAGPVRVRGWTATTGGHAPTTGGQGGQGGQILRVTTLAASGPGSLKAAIDTPGARTVVFEVGGVIDMAGGTLDIRHPHITIAGQTAPSPGITVIKAETLVRTHDVVIQHLRFRPGEYGRPKKGGGDQDGLSTVGGARDVIVDHCSFSWGTDENLSASGPRFAGDTPDDWRRGTSHRITFTHNLIYEGLSNSVHDKGEHSKGSLIHDNTSGVLLYGNVYASNRERNALFKGGARGAMVNNLVFNPGRRAVHYNLLAQEWAGKPYQQGRLTLVGNWMRHGPSTEPATAFFTLRGAGELALHLHDNLVLDRHGQPLGLPLVDDQSQGQARWVPMPQPELPAGLLIRPAARLPLELPPIVGARPWDRDPIDARLLGDLAAGRGRIIDSERENPLGYPAAAEPTRRAFDPEAWNLDDMSPKAGWASLYNAARTAAGR
jgi:lysophospholipase L1-like esterase